MNNLDATHELLTKLTKSIINLKIEAESFPTRIRKEPRAFSWSPTSKKYTGALWFRTSRPVPGTDYTFYLVIGDSNARLLLDGVTLVVKERGKEARYKLADVEEDGEYSPFFRHVSGMMYNAFKAVKSEPGCNARPAPTPLTRNEKIARRAERRRMRAITRHVGQRRTRALSRQR